MTRKTEQPHTQINFRTTRSTVYAVKSAAFAQQCSMQSWLCEAVKQKLAAEGHTLPAKREAA